jgi:hypothetical protein
LIHKDFFGIDALGWLYSRQISWLADSSSGIFPCFGLELVKQGTAHPDVGQS